MKKLLTVSAILLFLLGGMGSFEYYRLRDNKLHIITCDVGQGMAILIRTPGNKDILYDVGPGDAVLGCLSAYMPWWDHSIDLVILSHPHTDHYEGLFALLDRYTIKAFATQGITDLQAQGQYTDLLGQIKARHIPTQYVFAGDTYKLSDGVILNIYAPERGERQSLQDKDDLNERSVIMELVYQEFSMLFTGDSPAALVEESTIGIDVDVLQVPHHGSKTGLDENTLTYMRPELAVIALGKKNKYGHPHSGILKLLQTAAIPVLRTDINGIIEVISDGTQWWVK